jgi:hypothetical protein
MEKVTFTRKELYELVWQSTFGVITKKYGISGFGIRKARALRFFDTLIKLLNHRGHSITKGKYGYGTAALIDGIKIRLYLREATRRVISTRKYYNYDYVPTGEFIFQIGESYKHQEWRDGKTYLLEDLIPKIVAKLELDAKKEKEWEEECRISKIKREKEEAIKKIFLERKQKELSNFKQLLSNAQRLDKTTKMRNYIKTVEENALANNSLNEELKNWIVWAKDKVDWYDPLISKEDDFLSDYDFKNLV